ncbi:MAG TPA: zinc ribbon domain-containing protein [Pyrinomonadaceae bacterium]|nr:zinc ribbon domain-containing protein [Pyrinomonadaceae bacterium]
MKSGICPKCGSDEVYMGRTGSWVGVRTNVLHNQWPETYVCIECGYYEFYAIPGYDLDQVKKRLEKVKK